MNTINTHNRWLIVVAVMSATLMQVLDTTIVNVALPHMQGSLSAAPDQISWVLTSYLVASAIMMPLTGYFSDKLGGKTYLLLCICGFTLTSILCGMANSLFTIVLFRILQGICGAALVPLSQAILIDIYPIKELGKAMAIWGGGIMIGPVLGPTIGGYLTDIASWRWTFYINVPVGIMAILLAWKAVPETVKKARNFDWTGFLLLACATGTIQYLFDRGNQDDWFSSHNIQFAAVIATLSFIGFIIYALRKREKAVIDVSVFKDRNFTIASLILFPLGIGIYGFLIIQPLMLENLLNYPVFTAGLIMAPRAISVIISMIIMGKISHRVDCRWLVALGITLGAIGAYTCTFYTMDINEMWLILPPMIQGFGMGTVFVATSTITFATLPKKLRVEGSGINNLLRTISSSIGIAITLTIFTRHTQIAWNQLVKFVHPYNSALIDYLHKASLHIKDPLALPLVANELAKQAQMLSIINVFAFIMWSFLIMLPLVFLFKGNTTTFTKN